MMEIPDKLLGLLPDDPDYLQYILMASTDMLDTLDLWDESEDLSELLYEYLESANRMLTP